MQYHLGDGAIDVDVKGMTLTATSAAGSVVLTLAPHDLAPLSAFMANLVSLKQRLTAMSLFLPSALRLSIGRWLVTDDVQSVEDNPYYLTEMLNSGVIGYRFMPDYALVAEFWDRTVDAASDAGDLLSNGPETVDLVRQVMPFIKDIDQETMDVLEDAFRITPSQITQEP